MPTQTINTYASVNTSVTPNLTPTAVYSKALLKMIMNQDFVFMTYGTAKALPLHYGKTINFRRYTALTPVSTPLTEAVLPDSDIMAGSAITATVAQYGAYIMSSDLNADESFDDGVKAYIIAQAQQASASLDNLIKKELADHGSPYYINGTSPATMDVANGLAVPTIDFFRKAQLVLSRNNIGPHEKGAGKYIALVDDSTIFDLMTDTRLLNYMQYGNTNAPMVDNFVADMFGLRFIRNRNASVDEGVTVKDGSGTATADIHHAFVLGAEAYGVVKLDGRGVEVIIKALGSAGTADPLNQVQTIAWKINGFTAKVLTPLAVQKLLFVPTNQ